MAKPTRAILFRLATSEAFEAAVRRAPGGERLAWRAASRYVAGTSREDAIRVAGTLRARGYLSSLDLIGEQAGDRAEARRAADGYVELAESLAGLEGAWLSVDLSQIGLDLSPDVARGHLERIAEALPPDRRIQVGGEDAARGERIFPVVLAMARERAPVAATLQANLRTSPKKGARLAEAGVPIRLVKGAYVEPHAIALPWGAETDAAYARLARTLHAGGAELTLATHDPVLREALLPELDGVAVEHLLGVREDDAEELVRRGHAVRFYVPFGEGWVRYWMRRVAEARGA